MANCCVVSLTAEFKSPEDAKAVFDQLLALRTEANKKGEGFLIDGEARAVFDSDITLDTDTRLYMGCWVKWYLACWDLMRWIKGFKAASSSVQVEYGEEGDELFGQYDWDGRVLTQRWLPSENYPRMPDEYDDDDDKIDEWYEGLPDKLSEALAKYGKTDTYTEADIAAEEAKDREFHESLKAQFQAKLANVDKESETPPKEDTMT